jgi:Zn-finger nucleic acid-binding protein
MNRKNFARISGVIIDECGSHGVWLDAGEMEKIRLFIADGGLEKAQDKKIEKTAMELRDLAKKVDQTAFMQKLLHFWKIKRWLFGD